VRLHSWHPALPRHPGPRPEVHPIARWQVQFQPLVTTLRHHSVAISDAVGLLLIELLDGSRDVSDLPGLLFTELQKRGAVDLAKVSPDQLKAELIQQLPGNLQKLADLGLFMK